VFAGEVACTFRDGAIVEILDAASLDSYWSDDSSCQCIRCNWSGRVGDLASSDGKSLGSRRRRRESRLNEIEQGTIRGDCPEAIRHDVGQLIGMIRQLETQVQILETVRRAGGSSRIVRDADTVIF
jgi:hypothetical protein